MIEGSGMSRQALLELYIEGRVVRALDIVQEFGFNVPVVMFFSASDVDGDGYINIEMRTTHPDREPNPTVSAIYVFDPDDTPGSD